MTTSYTDALGHDFTIDQGYKKDEQGNAIEPTQFRPGIRIYKCSRCDATEEREVESESKHIHSSVANGYYDYNNTYKRNEPGTCVKKAKIGVYCRTCFVDKEGNFYSSESEAPTGVELTRYFVGYYEGDLDPNNHVNTETITSTESSYFYGSKSEVKCKDCNTVISTTINDKGKVSAVGHWKGEGVFIYSGKEESYSYSFNHDISLFENGTSLLSSSFVGKSNGQTDMSGDYMEMNVQFDKNNKLQNFNRAINGAWVGKTWATDVYQEQDYNGGKKNLLYLNPVSKEYIEGGTALVMASCDVDKGIMNWDFFLNGTQLLELKKETLPEVKSVLTIANFNRSLIGTTFTEGTDGVYTVILPVDTKSISLEWVTLQGNEPTSYSWVVDETTQTEKGTTFNLILSDKPIAVLCTANGETHSAIFSVQK